MNENVLVNLTPFHSQSFISIPAPMLSQVLFSFPFQSRDYPHSLQSHISISLHLLMLFMDIIKRITTILTTNEVVWYQKQLKIR